MVTNDFPILYELNTRVWLANLSAQMGREVTLDEIPDAELDRLKAKGPDWLYMPGVWATGPKAQQISQQHPAWQPEFAATLPDLKPEDIGGSCFAIADYMVNPRLGGNAALQHLRKRFYDRGVRIMLDFVSNHVGPDHDWVQQHPEYFVQGKEEDLQKAPQNYTRVQTNDGEKIMAYGRNPDCDGWPDTLQLNYGNPDTVAAMKNELIRVSEFCDGVCCDMAMLVLPEVFERTWGYKVKDFWPEAIQAVRQLHPDFCLLGEGYWDMEWILQQQGFDYTYDKRLYDRLRTGNASLVREHLKASLDYQQHSARFLENHHQERVAAIFDRPAHLAAAIITYTLPGLRFFHQGQLHGFTKRISPHLIRGPLEPSDGAIFSFYQRLLAQIGQPVYRSGEWHLLDCKPAWEGNPTWQNFIAYTWLDDSSERIIVVNYAPHAGQCLLQFPWPDMYAFPWLLISLMGDAVIDCDGHELCEKGLFLDMQPWHYHVFDIQRKLPGN